VLAAGIWWFFLEASCSTKTKYWPMPGWPGGLKAVSGNSLKETGTVVAVWHGDDSQDPG
jgi:hypothetical protein